MHRLLILCASLIVLAGCDRSRPSVVLYVSADEHVAREVIATFEQRTGIDVHLVTDTEASKTTALVERLRSERGNPQADVFWSSEAFMTVDLADEGILERFVSPQTESWPEAWRDEERRWYGFAGRARVIVYASDRVSDDEAPQTWMELTRDRWRDRIVMADPRFGTTGGHLGAMKVAWDPGMPGFYDAFLEGLAANRVRLLPSGNAGVVRAVVDGEADIGLTDTDDVWAAQARGAGVKLVYPRHDVDPHRPGGGTLLIPNTVARVRGGASPVEAAQLIDFLLSAEVEEMLATSTSHNVPLGPGRADAFPRYAVPDPLDVDLAAVARARQAAVDRAMSRLSR